MGMKIRGKERMKIGLERENLDMWRMQKREKEEGGFHRIEEKIEGEETKETN
jgi:hypothetical protein